MERVSRGRLASADRDRILVPAHYPGPSQLHRFHTACKLSICREFTLLTYPGSQTLLMLSSRILLGRGSPVCAILNRASPFGEWRGLRATLERNNPTLRAKAQQLYWGLSHLDVSPALSTRAKTVCRPFGYYSEQIQSFSIRFRCIRCREGASCTHGLLNPRSRIFGTRKFPDKLVHYPFFGFSENASCSHRSPELPFFDQYHL